MNKTIRYTLATAMTLAFAAMPAQADSIKDKLDNLQISGFVDASFSSSNAKPKQSGITLDQIELDIEYSEDNVGLRFDIQSTNDQFTNQAATGNIGNPIEQGYVYINFDAVGDTGTTFTFGKFNAPIGWELLDAPDMYQFSHAMVFNEGLPTNVTGASIAATFGILDAIIYTGKLDLMGVDTNALESTGGRIGISPMEGANIGFSYIRTKTAANPLSTTFDIDFTYDAVENLIVGGEYNQTKVVGAAKSYGYFVTTHYDFTEQFGATYRYGFFDVNNAAPGTAIANTIALTASLGGGLGAIFEYRSDNNSGGSAALPLGNINTYAFEMTYGF